MVKIPPRTPDRHPLQGSAVDEARQPHAATPDQPATASTALCESPDSYAPGASPGAGACPSELPQGGARGVLDLLSRAGEVPPVSVEGSEAAEPSPDAVLGEFGLSPPIDPLKQRLLRRMLVGEHDDGDLRKLCWAADQIDARALAFLAEHGVGIRFRDVEGRRLADGGFEIVDRGHPLGEYDPLHEEIAFLGDIVTREPDGSSEDWPVHLEGQHLAHELAHAWDDLQRDDTGSIVGRVRLGEERWLSDDRELRRLHRAHKRAVAGDPARSFSQPNVRPGYECESPREYVAEGLALLLQGQDQILLDRDPELYALLRRHYDATVGRVQLDQ